MGKSPVEDWGGADLLTISLQGVPEKWRPGLLDAGHPTERLTISLRQSLRSPESGSPRKVADDERHL